MRTIAGLSGFIRILTLTAASLQHRIDTMHAARISGGDVSNIISGRAEALLDIRLTETSTVEDLAKNLREACASGRQLEIVSASTPVVMSEDNPQILAYKRLAEQVTGRKNSFSSRLAGHRCAAFCGKRGDGDNVFRYGRGHADGEYVVWQSVEELARFRLNT